MPRKSAASLALVPSVTQLLPRLKPPRRLSKAEQRHWLGIVSALPTSAFDAVDAPALAAYCNHAAQAEQLGVWLAEHGPTDPQWGRVNSAQALHSRAALAWARSLRLTRVARSDRDRSATAARRGNTAPVSFEQMLANYRRQADEG
jgi:hypothetical protein